MNMVLMKFLCRPDYTAVGGTKYVGNGSTEVSSQDHKTIMQYADTYFPWLKVSVS